MKAIENCSERNEPLGRVLQSVANRFRRLGDENLQKEGITLCQLRVIVFIAKSKGSVPQKDLEDAFEIRRSSVTGILKNMEKNGLIRREISSEDGRVKRLLLTEKGRALDESLKNDIHSLENGMVHDFSTEERALLHSFLLRMAKNLDEIERKRV